MEIIRYTRDRIADVLDFEAQLREEESDWGWKIDDSYKASVQRSFDDPRFDHSLSLLAYAGGKVVGRIDSSLICSRFDGSVKAYLDWLCVLKSCRHQGVAQALMQALRTELRTAYRVDTLIALIAGNPEAQRFYRALPGAVIRDEGIWIDC